MWGASKFETFALCPGKLTMEQDLPNTSSKYAAEGTAAHQVLTWALQQGKPAADFLDASIEVDGFIFVVDEEMVEPVQVCIDYVRDLVGDDGVLLVDQLVNYSEYLGCPKDDGFGTADVIVIRGEEVIVVDYKHGRGVEVSAEKNPQIMLYALGALEVVQDLMGDFSQVRMAISQPRVSVKPSEFDMSVHDLELWVLTVAREAVVKADAAMASYSRVPIAEWEADFLVPGEKQCKFCKAKATCPALVAEVKDTVGIHAASPDEFASAELECAPEVQRNDWLAVFLGKVDLIEDWCKAVRSEVERRMLAGETVPGYKLVQGKQGNRAWSDAKAVEELFKSMRLKESEMYDFKLISPTTAEKLNKAKIIGPRQWPKVQELITRAEGAKHVAPLSDSRPALTVTPVVDDFTDVTVTPTQTK